MAYTQYSQLTIEGNLVKAKELLTAKNDTKYINFTIVNNKAKNPKDHASDETYKTWIECVAFGKDAEFINSLPTGASLLLNGSFYQNEYEYKTDNGETKQYKGLALTVDRLSVTRFTYTNMLKKEGGQPEPSAKVQNTASQLGMEISDDNELPF